MNKLGLVIVAAGMVGVAEGAELYVDKTGADGAYTTIQAAIDAAASGDTIYVRPGIYAEGGARESDADCLARVLVTKPLDIISTGGAAVTHIVGASDTDTGVDYGGRGPNAVRCVRFTDAGSPADRPSVLKGFTIRDGRCAQQYNGDAYGGDVKAGHPAGVTGSGSSSANNFYVVDCVIDGNHGVRGGNVRFGHYVRCVLRNGYGQSGDHLGREVECIGCLFPKVNGDLMLSTVVNCTFVDGPGQTPFTVYQSNSIVLNSVVAHCSTSISVTPSDATRYSKNSALPFHVNVEWNETDCVYGLDLQLFAPLRGDFHVRAGTPCATLGSATVLDDAIARFFSKPPALADIRRDLDGNLFAATGSIPAGCYATVKTAAGGALRFHNRRVVCDGYEISADSSTANYAFSEKPYDTIRVSPPAGRSYFCYARGSADGGMQYPEMDESFVAMMPPAGVVVTNEPYYTLAHRYVSPSGVDDAEHGLTEDAPWKTLKYAVENSPGLSDAANSRVLIHAAAGTYDEGVMVVTDTTARVRVNLLGKHIRLKGAGRGRSFIKGAPDPDTDPSALDRRGPNAVKCVHLGSSQHYNCVQGFTIADGYSDAGTDFTTSRYGGLVSSTASQPTAQVLDCELVGGEAYRAAQAYNGMFTRCIFHGRRLTTGGHSIRYATLRSCIVYDNVNNTSCSIDSTTMYLTTLHSFSNAPVHFGTCSIIGVIASSRYTGSLNMTAADAVYGNAIYKDGSGVALGDDVARKVSDAGFADPANGDFRLRASSEILGNLMDGVPADCWKNPATDVYGQPIDFTHGKMIPGAVQTPAPVLVVKGSQFGSFSQTGTNVVEVGDSLSVDFSSSTATRRFESLVVNGEPVDGLSWTYTPTLVNPFDENGNTYAPAILEALYSTNWYVKVGGNDAANGQTPETAWASLEQANASGVLAPGDCVHVAPGDYDSGRHEDATNGDSRFYVPEGVTFLADEGPAVTRILGASGSGANGRGTGAMRCCFLGKKAEVRGFTFANGRVVGTGTDAVNLNMGGGYCTTYGPSSADCPVVRDCVITNCVAGRGGAGRYGRMVNCRLLYNNGTACTSVGYGSAIVGCYVDGCQQNQWCRNGSGVYRCTFGPNNVVGGNPFEGNGTVYDTIVQQSFSGVASTPELHNCLLLDTSYWTEELKVSKSVGCDFVATAADMGLDAMGHPLSTNSTYVVDRGAPHVADATLEGRDLAGDQRVYNGQIDRGAYEYDWRDIYRADLMLPMANFVAGEQVVENGGKVLVKDGQLSFSFTDSTLQARYEIPVAVTGSGTLVVTAGGTEVGRYTTADGEQTLIYRNSAHGNDMVFAYNPGSADEGGALIGAMHGGLRGIFINFR